MTSTLSGGSPEVDGRSALTDAFRLAAILESSPDAIIAWSLAGELTDWNRGAERLFGHARDEALGMPVSTLWKPEVRATLEDTVSRLSREGEVARFETENVRKDGQDTRRLPALRIAHSRLRNARGGRGQLHQLRRLRPGVAQGLDGRYRTPGQLNPG